MSENTGISSVISPTYERYFGAVLECLQFIARTEVDANDAVNQRVGRVSRLPWDAPGLICKQSFSRSADPPEPNLKTPRPEALASLLYQNIEAYAPRGSVHFLSQAIAGADPGNRRMKHV